MSDIHFKCPMCEQMIDSPSELASQLIDCPTCKATIEVPMRGLIKEEVQHTEPEPSTNTTIVAPSPSASQEQEFKLPLVEESLVAGSLTIIGCLLIFLALFVGKSIGSESTQLGWLVFFGGVVNGLVLLGFSRVIHNTSLSAQRLHRIEMLMQQAQDRKQDG